MDGSTLAVVVPLLFINGLIVWKNWTKCNQRLSGSLRQMAVSACFIDPLVSALTCPLAADLYSMFYWADMCEPFYVFAITVVMLVLYSSIFIVCFRIVAVMTPKRNHNTLFDSLLSLDIPTSSFLFSTLLNFAVTWLVLAVSPTSKTDAVIYEADTCFMSVKPKSVFIIFSLCLLIQLIHVLFYARLSSSIIQNVQHPGNSPDSGDPTEIHEDSNVKSVLLYSLTAVICLILTSVIRLSFTFCSCQYFITLATGLYFTNWLIACKLPLTGFLYLLFSKLPC